MALNWHWSEKCGHLKISQRIDETRKREVTYTLYQGNAYLIALHEYEQDGQEMYEMGWFFCDKEHMNNCLGLTKQGNNIFDNGRTTLLELVLSNDTNRYAATIAKAFRKAYPLDESGNGLKISVNY